MLMEFFGGVLVGWLSKKLMSALDWLFRACLTWLQAPPRLRCYVATVVYTKLLQRLVDDIHNAKITNRSVIDRLKRIDNWIYPRLRGWTDRAWSYPAKSACGRG